MAQNITLMGANYPDVPAVVLPKTEGGTATFHDMSGSLSFMGVDAEFIKQIHASETVLSSTTYASWTPSTSAKSIKATANSGTLSADFNLYEYIIRWRFYVDVVYNEGTTLKAAVDTECAEMYQACIRRANSLSSLEAMTEPGNACVTLFQAPLNVYYNASGTHTYTYSVSYGIYPGLTAASFSSATSLTPTITFKTPTYNARCNTTYFSTTMAKAVNQTDTIIKLVGEVYRVDKGALANRAYYYLSDLYANGLTIV